MTFSFLKKKKDPVNLLKRLLQPQDISYVPAIKWGIEKEYLARSAYVAKVSPLHQGFECSSSGLIVNCRYPHLGASLDALVRCDCVVRVYLKFSAHFQAENAIQLSFKTERILS